MTSIPAHLPALMKSALEAGASLKVDPLPSDHQHRPEIHLAIIWTDKTINRHHWRLGPDQVWSHKGPGRLIHTRARIERETSNATA